MKNDEHPRWAKWEHKNHFTEEDKAEYEEEMWSDRTPEEWAENKFGRSKGEIVPPIDAIRKKCLDCCCGSMKEVRLCPSCDCYLYPYRFGEDPRRKNIQPSEAQKKAWQEAGERLKRHKKDIQAKIERRETRESAEN